MGEYQIYQRIKDDMRLYLEGMLIGNICDTTYMPTTTLDANDFMKDIYIVYHTLIKSLSGQMEVTFENAEFNHPALIQMMGYKIVETEFFIKEYKQCKTHKKKRINKKWLKKYGTYPVYDDDDNYYMIGDTLYGSPTAIKKLKEHYAV